MTARTPLLRSMPTRSSASMRLEATVTGTLATSSAGSREDMAANSPPRLALLVRRQPVPVSDGGYAHDQARHGIVPRNLVVSYGSAASRCAAATSAPHGGPGHTGKHHCGQEHELELETEYLVREVFAVTDGPDRAWVHGRRQQDEHASRLGPGTDNRRPAPAAARTAMTITVSSHRGCVHM